MGGTHGVATVAGPEGTKAGLRAIWTSAIVLAVTTAVQFAVVAVGNSAALLADALDNLGDVVTTVTLAVAFLAARRAADARYTFGYQRLEDLGGVFVVLVIWLSAGYAAWESYRKLVGDHEVQALGIGMAAALLGAVGNEAVARYKISVGRKIRSQPLIADGQHARTDALASVAAFLGLLGAQLGFVQADPIAGLVITVAIVAIAWDVSRHVLARLLDAVDPDIINRIDASAAETPGVLETGLTQARWAGRSLYVTLTVAVDGSIPLQHAHEVAEAVHHKILHDIPGVAQVDVHVDPWKPHAHEAHVRTHEHRSGVSHDHHAGDAPDHHAGDAPDHHAGDAPDHRE